VASRSIARIRISLRISRTFMIATIRRDPARAKTKRGVTCPG
jgi:hypothetical protein